uniref:Candidate secreted effector n=1 Tax=Meloidogyne incognita TaxID=6306 RepID=A0A914KJU4_MELIC
MIRISIVIIISIIIIISYIICQKIFCGIEKRNFYKTYNQKDLAFQRKFEINTHAVSQLNH